MIAATQATQISVHGESVPALGFGTWQLAGKEARAATRTALETGYRHLDCARIYGNEDQVGKGLKDAGIAREELWITSKVWIDSLDAKGVASQIDDCRKDLGIEFVDLMLIHWPNPSFELGETIEALQKAQQGGAIRHWGLSNFPSDWLEKAFSYGDPFCNQVECHVYLRQRKLRQIAVERDLLFTAYSPLARGKIHADPTLQEIGRKHGKSPAQVALRWLVEQENVAAIPRSRSPEHIAANFSIFDFALDGGDLANIEQMPDGQRLVDPDFGPTWDAE